MMSIVVLKKMDHKDKISLNLANILASDKSYCCHEKARNLLERMCFDIVTIAVPE